MWSVCKYGGNSTLDIGGVKRDEKGDGRRDRYKIQLRYKI
jgi:hypothetical protein